MSELPEGWALAILSDTVVRPKDDIVGGPFGSNLKASEYKTNGIPIIRLQNIARNKFIEKNINYVTKEKAESLKKHSFVAGDIAVTKLGEPLGKATIIPETLEQGVIVADIVRVRLDPEFFDKRYVCYAINSPIACEEFEKHTKGTTRQRVNLGHIRGLQVPVAPLNEQKRIADKLDMILKEINCINSRLDKIQIILKNFRQSVLVSAISGEITKDWRVRKKSGFSWKKYKISDVSQVGTGSTPLRSNKSFYSSSGVPWVTSSLTRQSFIHESDYFVTKKGIKAARLKLYPAGTILVAMYGEGKTRGQVSELAINATINQACSAIIVNEDIVRKEYMKLALQANYLEMRKLAEGGSQPNLNLSKIKSFVIPVPCDEEQVEVISRAEALLSLADQIEEKYNLAMDHIDKITQSMLAKAFRGELVLQSQNDEPAVAILKKIKRKKIRIAEQEKIERQKKVSRRDIAIKEIVMEPKKNTKIPPSYLSNILRKEGSLTAEKLWEYSQLDIDVFYDQLKEEESKNLLREEKENLINDVRLLVLV